LRRNIRSDSSYKRKPRNIRPRPFFLIVCEGQNTEVDYFKSFPYYRCRGVLSRGQFFSHGPVHVVGKAGQHESVVNKAEEIYQDLVNEYGYFSRDEVWCVFDCDENDSALKKAVQLAESRGFRAIYSVQCFELWYLLHFENITSPIRKSEYDKRIGGHLKINYTHGTTGMYDRLLPYQSDAILRAERLLKLKQNEGEMSDPVTKVFELVKALNDAHEKHSKL